MDTLTAGTALILVQVCIAVVMTGVFYATPSEKCTRYWALSAMFVAFGVLLVVLNAGALRYAVLIIGNNMLVVGIILQWVGIRAFYKKRPGAVGWFVGIAFFLSFGLLLLRGATVAERALLSTATILFMFLLSFSEVWRAPGSRRSFAGVVTLAALGILTGSYVARFAGLATGTAELNPGTNSLLSTVLVYLLPMTGGLLLSTGLLLLYFKQIIADKHHLATHDELTGVLNRRAILDGAEREVAVAKRLGEPVAVAFVDIDHFKQINDRLGHDAGDRVIREVAQTLRQNCRSIDLVGRYGGDEFCIVFPGTSSESAAVVGERLLSAIRRHESKGVRSVTTSIGLAAMSRGGDDESPADLIRRADEELYKAKASGRNRISVAPEPVTLRSVSPADAMA